MENPPLQPAQSPDPSHHFLKRGIGVVDKTSVSVTPSQFDMLRKSLETVALRHRVASQNLANVNTPGYQASEVSFEEPLQRQLAQGEVVWDSLTPEVKLSDTGVSRVDGNNVDLDQEVTQLNKNAALFETYTQLLATKLAMMKSAITGR